MAPIYAKLDDLTNLTAAELVDEIYNDDPDVILDVIRRNRRAPRSDASTNTERLATVISAEKLEADDVIDGFVEAQVIVGAERGTALRELLASVFEASVGLEPALESEQTLMLAFGEKRFSDVVVMTALWESYSFTDLAQLLRMLIDKMEEHCDDEAALAVLRGH